MLPCSRLMRMASASGATVSASGRRQCRTKLLKTNMAFCRVARPSGRSERPRASSPKRYPVSTSPITPHIMMAYEA